ncbi:MAG: hypothetical protein ACRC62_37080 [Microcoleus sp.]
MIAAIEKLETTEIAEIAEKYRQQGYQVLVRQRNYNWQKFIQNQEIDLAIYTIQESVIAALKPRPSESRVNKTPEEEMMEALYDYRQHDLSDIQVYMTRASAMMEKGDFDIATCSIAVISESVMRMVAEHHSINFEIQEPQILAQTFLAHGLINDEDYELLVAALEIRDRVIFQQEKVAVDLKLASDAFAALEHLLSKSGQVAE